MTFEGMDVKHDGRAQKGLVHSILLYTLLSSQGASGEARGVRVGWGMAESSGGRSPPFPGPLTAGSEPYAKMGGRQGVYFRDVWGPTHSFLSLYQTQLPVLSKTPRVPSLSREAAGLRQAVPLECHWWPGPSHGHSPLQPAEEIHSQVALCRRQESVALAQTMTLGP